MVACHRENVGRAIDKRRRERLAAQSPDVYSFLLADLHGVHTWRLASYGVHPGGRDFDIFPIAEEPAEKALCHRAPANISCTNEEDTFHDSKPARCRLRNLKSNRIKSTRGSGVVGTARCVANKERRFTNRRTKNDGGL